LDDGPPPSAIVITHAHADHHGLVEYARPDIPIHLSLGAKVLVEFSDRLHGRSLGNRDFRPLIDRRAERIGDFTLRHFLMDHSGFDARAVELAWEGRSLVYTGDFRGHGRKASCLDRFLKEVGQEPEALLLEGTTVGRPAGPGDLPSEADVEVKLTALFAAPRAWSW
jgi:ribonuclease J